MDFYSLLLYVSLQNINFPLPLNFNVSLLCGRSPDLIPASYLGSLHVGNLTGTHAACQMVSRCHTRGKSEESVACKWGIHPGFETQCRHHQKSKTGVSVAPQKASNFFFQIKLAIILKIFFYFISARFACRKKPHISNVTADLPRMVVWSYCGKLLFPFPLSLSRLTCFHWIDVVSSCTKLHIDFSKSHASDLDTEVETKLWKVGVPCQQSLPYRI